MNYENTDFVCKLSAVTKKSLYKHMELLFDEIGIDQKQGKKFRDEGKAFIENFSFVPKSNIGCIDPMGWEHTYEDLHNPERLYWFAQSCITATISKNTHNFEDFSSMQNYYDEYNTVTFFS